MIPTSAVFNSVLEIAKSDSKVQALLAQRDNHRQAYLIELQIKFVKRQGDWMYFEVLFEYRVQMPEMEKNDDVRVIVPWNYKNNQFGEVPEPQVF